MAGGTGPGGGVACAAGSAAAAGAGSWVSPGSGARRRPTYSVDAPFRGDTGAAQLLPGAPAGIHCPSAGAGCQLLPPSIVGDGCNGGIDGGGGGGAQAETGSAEGGGAG